MKQRLTIILCCLPVLLAILLLVGTKSKTFGKKLLAEQGPNNISYGDLYGMCGLPEFKFPIPVVDFNSTSTLEEAGTITLGDSFFQAKFESKGLPDLLADNLKKTVFDPHEIIGNPLVYLAQHHYQKTKSKTIVVETIERYAAKRAASYDEKIIVDDSTTTKQNFKKTINDAAYEIFDQTDLNYFFKHNLLINPLRIFINDLEFKTLGLVNDNIGRYSITPPMLFYSEEVDFDTDQHVTDNIDVLAQKIKWLDDTLKEKYNLDMIYVVIPNKYTVYNYLDKNGSYNNFIPELQTRLEKEKVNYVDLYTPYMNYVKNPNAPLLYYPNETHYSAVGKNILVQELMKKIK